jgi:hypothetical protein
LAQTTISCLWNQPDAADHFNAGVSLHSHTNRSKESLGFIQEYAQRSRILNWALERQYKRSRVPVDLSKAYWTPPLTPKLAFETERNQIEGVLGLRGLVALTDHDSIEAPMLLRMAEESRHIPISFEWAVPFSDAIFHLGVHNLPSRHAEEIVAELEGYTEDPNSCDPTDLIAMLDQIPEVLVIFNHPLWDLRCLKKPQFLGFVDQFLGKNAPFLHAFELNATRCWKENDAVVQLADRWRHPIISGGDRHGCEPSGALNLTHATSFPEFIHEVRQDQRSHVLFMPQYAESLCMRTFQTLLDVIRDYPEYAAGSQRWDDRVFHADLSTMNGVDRPVSSYWNGPPAFLKRIFSVIRLLENPQVRRMMAHVLPGKTDLELSSEIVEVAPEVVYEATL